MEATPRPDSYVLTSSIKFNFKAAARRFGLRYYEACVGRIRPQRREQMNKLYSLVFAIGMTTASVMAADAMPAAQYGSLQPRLTIQVATGGCDVGAQPGPDGKCALINARYYSGRHHRYRQASRYAYRTSYYYNSGYVTDADPFAPGSGRFCAYGSYVACVASGTYCLQRCY